MLTRVSPGTVSVPVGTSYTITINVSNSGPDMACSVFADFTLPNNTMWLSDSGAICALIAGKYRCNIGDIASGGSATPVRFTLRPTASGSSSGNVTLRLSTTDPNTGNNSAGYSTNIPLRAPDVRVTFKSELTLDGARVTGRIVLNGAQSEETDNSAPRVHVMRARGGENVLEAYPGPGTSNEGRWRFDFSGAADFVPGSLRVESGVVLATGTSSVVFAVRPGSDPLRLKFVLEAAGRRSSEPR